MTGELTSIVTQGTNTMSVTSDAPVDPRQEVPWPDEPPEPPPPKAAPPAGAVQRAPGPVADGTLPIGRLRRADPVELWRFDAFAAWLADNLDEIGKLVGIKLTAGESDGAAPGTVLATDPDGAPVRLVVELGPSSDESLGLLMRQLVASGAKTAVWICAQAREEHLSSVTWLNREIAGRLHVVTVEAVRIDDSVPAPIFRLALRADDGGGQAAPR